MITIQRRTGAHSTHLQAVINAAHERTRREGELATVQAQIAQHEATIARLDAQEQARSQRLTDAYGLREEKQKALHQAQEHARLNELAGGPFAAISPDVA